MKVHLTIDKVVMMHFLSPVDKKTVSSAIVVLFLATCVFASSDFWFVQITDTHWGKDDNLARTKKVVAAVNALPLKPAFAVHTGDIADKSAPNIPAALDSGLAIMKSLKCPVYFVPGNNDIHKKHFKEASAEFVRRFGGLSTLSITPDASIITLFDYPDKEGKDKVDYDMLGKLDSLLKLAPRDLPVLIFQHFPVIDDFYEGGFHIDWTAETQDKFIALCDARKVSAVICGHYHRDELHWMGSVPEFIAPPVAAKMGRQASFRLYHYQNGKVSYFTQYF